MRQGCALAAICVMLVGCGEGASHPGSEPTNLTLSGPVEARFLEAPGQTCNISSVSGGVGTVRSLIASGIQSSSAPQLVLFLSAVPYTGPGTYRVGPGASGIVVSGQTLEPQPVEWAGSSGSIVVEGEHDRAYGTVDAELSPRASSGAHAHLSGTWSCQLRNGPG